MTTDQSPKDQIMRQDNGLRALPPAEDRAVAAKPSSRQGVSPVPASIPSANRLEYRFSIQDRRERHDWIISGDLGAINIWAEPTAGQWPGEWWLGGIECHSATDPGYSGGHHEHCWLLGKECWHDGSSLQFREQVEPCLPVPTGKPMPPEKLDQLTGILRSRYQSWLIEPAEERDAQAMETRRAATTRAVGEADDSPVAESDALNPSGSNPIPSQGS